MVPEVTTKGDPCVCNSVWLQHFMHHIQVNKFCVRTEDQFKFLSGQMKMVYTRPEHNFEEYAINIIVFIVKI